MNWVLSHYYDTLIRRTNQLEITFNFHLSNTGASALILYPKLYRPSDAKLLTFSHCFGPDHTPCLFSTIYEESLLYPGWTTYPAHPLHIQGSFAPDSKSPLMMRLVSDDTAAIKSRVQKKNSLMFIILNEYETCPIAIM